MPRQTIELKVKRQDTPTGRSRWEEFSLPWQPNMNVVACLMEIRKRPVTKSGANIQICWSPVSDACLIGYRVLGAATPTSDANFSTVADVGLTTCWTGSTALKDFLVVARGTGGTGPWGAYGH